MPRIANLKNLEKRPRGRPKGAKDKISSDIRQRVIDVWNQLEKTPGKSLASLSKTEPKWFFDTFGRALLPKDIKLDGSLEFSGMMDLAVSAAKRVLSDRITKP